MTAGALVGQESKLSGLFEELKGQKGVASQISEQLPGGFSVNQVRSMLKKRGLLTRPAKRARREVCACRCCCLPYYIEYHRYPLFLSLS